MRLIYYIFLYVLVGILLGIILLAFIFTTLFFRKKKNLCEVNQKLIDNNAMPQSQLDTINKNQKKKVLLCGMARDEAKKVPQMKKMAEKILSYFADTSEIIILENDSTDRTRELLLDWAKENNKVSILGCGTNVKKCTLNMMKTLIHDGEQKRIDKMVTLRNETLKHIMLPKYDDVEYVVMFDFDLVGELLNIENIIYTFETNEIVNAQCVLTIHNMNYYDPYAHLDVDEVYRNSKENLEWGRDMINVVGTGIKHVKSCFNGLAVYRLESLRNTFEIGGYCTYHDVENNEAVCEHVCIHLKMDGVYLNTNAILLL